MYIELVFMLGGQLLQGECVKSIPLIPLPNAICQGNESIVRQWIELGSPIDGFYSVSVGGGASEQFSLLDMAVRGGFIEIMSLLTQAGAEINQLTACGQSLFAHPISYGRKSVVKQLLALKADVNVQDKFGDTPLHYAWRMEQCEIGARLIARGANPEITNAQGHKPCRRSERYFWADELDDFSDIGLDMRLWHALCYGQTDEVKALVARGANVSQRTPEGTLYHLAVRYGYENMVEYLLEVAHKERDVPDNNGTTPLHLAATIGRERLVQMLVESQVDLHRYDNDDMSAYQLACRMGHHSIAAFIKQAILNQCTKKSWETHSQALIHEIADLLRDNVHDFEAIYRHVAKRRYQIKADMEPFHGRAPRFGRFFKPGDTGVIEKFYPEHYIRRPWAKESAPILAWLSAIVAEFKTKTDALNLSTDYQVECYTPSANERTLVLNHVNQVHRTIPYPADIVMNIYRYTNLYPRQTGEALPMLEYRFYEFPAYPHENFATLYYKNTTDRAVLVDSFVLAQTMFDDAMEPQHSTEYFLAASGRLMHFMAMLLPVKRGNASIVEMIVQAMAHMRGLEIKNLNQPPAPDELRWDFQAFKTPNPNQYADWFARVFLPHVVALNSAPPNAVEARGGPGFS